MKRLIYITYLGLLVFILISCQKENVAPDGALAATPTNEARIDVCRTYSFLTKNNNQPGIFQLGNIRTDYILVGFADNVTPAQQEAILSQYQIFDRLDGEVFFDSGIVTVVKLNSNATCLTVELMLASLERKRQVNFAGPTFNDPTGVLDWLGQTNEIIVTLRSDADYPQLQHLAKITKTTIVTNLFDQTYILSVDKKSLANTLQMTSLLNTRPFVVTAEPNFLQQALPFRTGEKPQRKLSKETISAVAAL